MSSWTKMSAAQRSAEMKKRQRVAKRNKKKKALLIVQDKETDGRATEIQDEVLPQDSIHFIEGYIIGRTEAAAESYAKRLSISCGFGEDHSGRILELLHAKWARGIAPVS